MQQQQQRCDTRPYELGHSVFHYGTSSEVCRDINDCLLLTKQYATALSAACEVGSRAAAIFASTLAGTTYAQSAKQMHGAVQQVEDITGVELRRMKQMLDTNWAQLSRYSGAGVGRDGVATGSDRDVELIVQCLMTFVESQFALYKQLAQHLAQFVGGALGGGGGVLSSPHGPGYPHGLQSSTQHRTSVQSTLEPKGKTGSGGGSGIRSFLSQFGAKKTDSQSSFYVPLDDTAAASTAVSMTGGDVQPSVAFGFCRSACDQTTRTRVSPSTGSTTAAAASAADVKKYDANCVTSNNSAQFATQAELDMVINMLSKAGSSSSAVGHGGFAPDPVNVHQNVSHSIYTPQNLNSLLRHRPSGDAKLGGFHNSSLDNRSAQRPSLSNSPHPLAPPDLFTGSIIHGGTNTWPYRPHEPSSLWTGTDMLAMQNIFGHGPVDLSLFSVLPSSTAVPGDASLGGPPTSTTWPINEDRLGRFIRNNNSDSLTSSASPSKMYGENNMWSVNHGGSLGIGDSWGSHYPIWMNGGSNLPSEVSVVADSSSCSDQSSNGGGGGATTYWSSSSNAAGQPCLNRRRHSSGETGLPSLQMTSGLVPEVNASTCVAVVPPGGAWKDPHHAPLVQTSSTVGDRSKMIGGHRLLSVQRSDPTLNNRRTLSCWDSGGTASSKSSSSDSGGGTGGGQNTWHQ